MKYTYTLVMLSAMLFAGQCFATERVYHKSFVNGHNGHAKGHRRHDAHDRGYKHGSYKHGSYKHDRHRSGYYTHKTYKHKTYGYHKPYHHSYHGYGHRSHRYRHSYHGHGSHLGEVILGGLVLGAIISEVSEANRTSYSSGSIYNQPAQIPVARPVVRYYETEEQEQRVLEPVVEDVVPSYLKGKDGRCYEVEYREDRRILTETDAKYCF